VFSPRAKWTSVRPGAHDARGDFSSDKERFFKAWWSEQLDCKGVKPSAGGKDQPASSLRNQSIASAVPSRSETFGVTPSSVRILVLSGTRRGMSS
jgi:hypothetical protein